MPAPVVLRPLRPGDEDAVLAAQRTLAAEGFDFALGLGTARDFADYLRQRDREHRGVDLPADRVPGSFWVVEYDGAVAGRTSIRHRLNDRLLRVGGHIGYCVLPPFRRLGLGTEVLRQSLVLVRGHGVERALLTCDADNVGSRTIIERCGGVLDPQVPQVDGDPPKLRYWIDVTTAPAGAPTG